MIHRALLVLALLQVGSVQDACHCEAKVGSEGVNGHGAPRVLNLQPWVSRGLLLQSPLVLELRSGLHHTRLVCPLVLHSRYGERWTKLLWSYLSCSVCPVHGRGIPLSFPLEGIKAEGSF